MSLYPFARTPFTDIGGYFLNEQQEPNSLCAKIEMRLFDCFEAYGLDGGRRKCMDFVKDLRECKYSYKQDARVFRMQYERHRQYYTGEREKHYEEPPRIHTV